MRRLCAVLYLIVAMAGTSGTGLGLPPLAQTKAGQNEALLHDAQRSLQQGYFQKAISGFQAVLRSDPQELRARDGLGLALSGLGEYAQSARELELVVAARPDVLAANLFLGLDYLKLGQPAKAIPHFQQALQLDPSNREAQSALIHCYEESGDYTAALRVIRKLSASEKDPAEGIYQLGKGYMALARLLASRLSPVRDRSAWAARLEGDLATIRNVWGDAAASYSQALTLDPNQPGLWAKLGRADLHLGKLPEAKAAFQSALRQEPHDSIALVGLADVALTTGSVELAAAAIQKAWSAFPPALALRRDFPVAALPPRGRQQLIAKSEMLPAGPAKDFLLAGFYRAAGEGARAGEHWKALERQIDAWRLRSGVPQKGETAAQACAERAYTACAGLLARKNPVTSQEQLTLGQALLMEGEDDSAAEAFAASLTAKRSSAVRAYWLAYTSMKLGVANWDHLLAAYPDSWHAYAFRGQAAELRAEHAQAIQQYRTALQLHPDDPELYEDLGHAYFGLRSYIQAEAALKAAVRLDPSRADALATLGSLYLDEHQDQKAAHYLEAAVRYDPSLLEAHAALGRAYMRVGNARLAAPELETAASIDRLGDIHFLLYRAYLQLGEKALAQKALKRSQELRKSSLNVPGSMAGPGP